ncbi:MAG: hypothetical protein M1833_000196 [Piccolia ochrophora]|nr:MAG: hypothetical protein M1833_000196 [Piccolia ochrophora]
MDSPNSPPRLRRRKSSTSSIDSFLSTWGTYIPLSNLPTPPPSHHSDDSPSLNRSLSSSLSFETLDPTLLGPATHLTRLLPATTYLHPPSIPLTHALLTRAALPLPLLAFAASILDSLSPRFSAHWRSTCPSSSSDPCFTISADQPPPPSTTTTSTPPTPEVIILSALALATKFADDSPRMTRWWAHEVGEGRWSCEQINATEGAVLRELGWRILGLWRDSVVEGAIRDMERCVPEEEARRETSGVREERAAGKMAQVGLAEVLVGGALPTPEPSPLVDNS